MILAGETSNLGGLVDLVNDQGSIIVVNSMYAATVSISAPNGAFAITFPGTAVLGGAPMSEWDPVLNYPGGNPHTALDITQLNNNANSAIAYVASSAYGSFTMSSLLGSSGSTNYCETYFNNGPTQVNTCSGPLDHSPRRLPARQSGRQLRRLGEATPGSAPRAPATSSTPRATTSRTSRTSR